MSSYFSTLLHSALVNNVVLVQFLGLCPLMGMSQQPSKAINMSIATGVVLILSSIMSWMIDHFLLSLFDASYLKVMAFILIIATLVQIIELLIKKLSPYWHRALGIYLPLITTNCAVLGIAIIGSNQELSFLENLVYGIGTAIGFGIVMIVFTHLRDRMSKVLIPKAFAGSPIALITAGCMALAFVGLNGIF